MKKILTALLTVALLYPGVSSAMGNREFVEGCLKGAVRNKACTTMLQDYYTHLTVIDRVARQEGMDYLLMRALVAYESRYKRTAGSPVGATGLTQVMPATAAHEYGLSKHHLYDPETSVRAGARYFMKQYRKFGNVELALAAYNAGPGRVQKAGNRIPNIRETREYVVNIMALWQKWKAKEQAGSSHKTRTANLPVSEQDKVSLPTKRSFGTYGRSKTMDKKPRKSNMSNIVQNSRIGSVSGNGIYSN